MNIEKTLLERSGASCELCKTIENLAVYEIPPDSNSSADQSILLCDVCRTQIENPDKVDINHWRCLNDCMWSPQRAVQVMAWRMLTRLRAEVWAQDLLDMLYLDEETLKWAQATGGEIIQDRLLVRTAHPTFYNHRVVGCAVRTNAYLTIILSGAA